MFTLNGTYKGQPAFITWVEGEGITGGTPKAVRALKRMAARLETVEFPCCETISESDHLMNGLAVAILCYELLWPVTQENGTVPRLPEVPEGSKS